MKSLLKREICSLFHWKNWSLIGMMGIVFIMVWLLPSNLQSFYLHAMGLTNTYHNILYMTYVFILNLYFIWWNYTSYRKDFTNSSEFLLLRMEKRKLLSMKLVLLFMNVILLNALFSLVVWFAMFLKENPIMIPWDMLLFGIVVRFFATLLAIATSYISNIGSIVLVVGLYAIPQLLPEYTMFAFLYVPPTSWAIVIVGILILITLLYIMVKYDEGGYYDYT